MSSWRVPVAVLCRIGAPAVAIGGVVAVLSSAPAESGDPAAERILLGVVASLAGAMVLRLAANLLEAQQEREAAERRRRG